MCNGTLDAHAQSSKSTKGSKSKYQNISESQLKHLFDLFDANHDGKLTNEEMKQMLENIGLEVSDKLISKIIKEASKTGNSCLPCPLALLINASPFQTMA